MRVPSNPSLPLPALSAWVLALGLIAGTAHAQSAAEPAASASAAAAAAVEGDAPATPQANQKDPFESFNRGVFSFNEGLDEHLLKPVAEGYRKVVPEMVRTGIDNVLNNLGDLWSIVNHLLQGKVEGSARMTMRVATNTVLGLGGLLDQATEMGLEREPEDLGQTLGRWGVPPGPYLVLPLLGPSTVRDAVATPANVYFGPTYFVENDDVALGMSVLNVINTRASLLGATQMLDQIAMDKYSFLRDAYLARRRNQVYDGDPPEEKTDDAEDLPLSAPAAAASDAKP